MAILATFGWILLGFLGFLLAVILLVLLFPFVYSVEGRKSTAEWNAKIHIRWLFGFLRVNFDLPKPGEPIIWILFFKFRSKKKNQEIINLEEAPSESTQATSSDLSVSIEEVSSEATETEAEKQQDANPVETTENSETNNAVDASSQNAPKKSFSKKITEVKEKISHIRDEIEYYKDLLAQDTTKGLIKHVLGRVGKILLHICPRKIKGNITFGASSPDITGYAFAGYSILKGRFPRRVCLQFQPDFENEILEGNILIKGHITIINLIIQVLKVLFDKRLRQTYRKLKKHMKK